jgi:hypothetical protein
MNDNGLTPAEFLRPFGEVGNLGNYQIKTTEKNEPYKLEKFRVNFVDSHRMYMDNKETNRIVERIFTLIKPEIPKYSAQVPSKQAEVSLNLLINDRYTTNCSTCSAQPARAPSNSARLGLRFGRNNFSRASAFRVLPTN